MRGSALKLTGIFWARRFGQTVRNTNEHLRLSIWPEGPRDEILPLTARGPRRHAQQRGLTWQTAARTEAGRGRWAGGGGCCCQHLWVRRGLPVPLLLPLHPPDQAGSHPKLGSLLFKGQPCYRCELALGETPLHREIHGGHTPLILWGALGNRCWQVQHLPTLRQQNSPTPRQTSCTPLGKFLFMWLLCELLKASHSGRRKTPRKKKKKAQRTQTPIIFKVEFLLFVDLSLLQHVLFSGLQRNWSADFLKLLGSTVKGTRKVFQVRRAGFWPRICCLPRGGRESRCCSCGLCAGAETQGVIRTEQSILSK